MASMLAFFVESAVNMINCTGKKAELLPQTNSPRLLSCDELSVRPMVTLGRYRGTAEELANFVVGVWQSSYCQKMTFPIWSAEYFRWQLRMEEEHTHLLAAYEGQRLAAVLLGAKQAFQTPAGVIPGSQWSWLSIHNDYRGQGLAVKLDQERVRTLKESGNDLVVSFRFVGSQISQAERPKAQANPSKQFLQKLGFWTRVIDPVRLHHWNLNRLEGVGALLSTPLAGIPRPGRSRFVIRPLEPDDLHQAAALMRRHTAAMPLAVSWDFEAMKHQLLGSSMSRTLVSVDRGQIRGLVNYHILPFQGRTQEPIGIFDLIAGSELPRSAHVQLINAAMLAMRDEGAILALKLRSGDVPATVMMQARFAPKLADSYLVLQWIAPPIPIEAGHRMHLLWR